MPQIDRKTRSTTRALPGPPDRLIESTILEIPKKKTTTGKKKATPKKATTTAKKATTATTPKVMKPKATKVTKTKKSPAAKPKAKAAATGKKTVAKGVKVIAIAKGKRRPRMAEEPLPSPVGYDDPVKLNEAFKRGRYWTSEGWFDMRKMVYLDGDDDACCRGDRIGAEGEQEKERGIDA